MLISCIKASDTGMCSMENNGFFLFFEYLTQCYTNDKNVAFVLKNKKEL